MVTSLRALVIVNGQLIFRAKNNLFEINILLGSFLSVSLECPQQFIEFYTINIAHNVLRKRLGCEWWDFVDIMIGVSLRRSWV